MKDIIQRILQIRKLPNDDIINLYTHGSHIYGTNTFKSDSDYIAISKSLNCNEIKYGKFNCHIYNIDQFQKNLNEHKIQNMECYFLPNHLKIEKHKFILNLNKELLVKSVLEKSKDSWNKGLKLIALGNEDNGNNLYRGKKSIFHSLRILTFGNQLYNMDKIVDYSAANSFYKTIMENHEVLEIENNYIILRNLLIKYETI